MDLSPGERMVLDLLTAAHLTPPDGLAGIVALHAEQAGLHNAVVYLVDLEQVHLLPMSGDAVLDRELLF
jgi:hypothetical protein